MENISPYIRIIRPLNLIFSALTVTITAFLLDQLQQSGVILTAMVVVVTFAGASNILNDIFDINIDGANQPRRPIPAGEISIYWALVYMLILYGMGIYLAFSLPKTA
ncbi:MAG: UbiA family prenyltransferase, partial [Candidatus Marinimicrobia bacterium]|nr:UbiA family prenyltransferase [Candidatus Neomarinimicrobiota bacterium]